MKWYWTEKSEFWAEKAVKITSSLFLLNTPIFRIFCQQSPCITAVTAWEQLSSCQAVTRLRWLDWPRAGLNAGGCRSCRRYLFWFSGLQEKPSNEQEWKIFPSWYLQWILTLSGLPPRPDTPIMLVSAVCCSVSLLNRMKPNPLLNPLSSRTTEKQTIVNKSLEIDRWRDVIVLLNKILELIQTNKITKHSLPSSTWEGSFLNSRTHPASLIMQTLHCRE